MHEQALSTAWSRAPRGMSDMRRLASHIVASKPWLQAAILFGSRARGTARQDSDWDVVLLAPERYRDEALRLAPRVPAVSYVPLSPRRLRERHNRLGTLERSVVRDGVLLAGDWIMPKSQKRQIVSYPDLANGLGVSASEICLAVVRLLAILQRLPVSGDNILCSATQDAGELLSKAALLHLGIHPPHTHNALELADELRKTHPHHDWIDMIESLNGLSKERHVAIYSTTILESFEASLHRLCMVVEFYIAVVETVFEKRPGIKGYLIRICEDIVCFDSIYQKASNWEQLPEDLKRKLLRWKRLAEGILKTAATDKSKTAKRRTP